MTTIRFTDDVLDRIADGIADHEPERGGALLGPVGIDAVTTFVADPTAAATAVTYQSSPELAAAVRRLELADPLIELKGIVHSHPHSFDTPSDQDRVAFADTLSLNEQMVTFAGPIVVRRRPRWPGTGQRVRLGESGWMTLWVATADDPFEIRAGRIETVPVSRDLRAIEDAGLGEAHGPFLVDVDGEPRLAGRVENTGRELTIVFSWNHPIDPPLVFLGSENGPGRDDQREIDLSWKRTTPKRHRLVTALMTALVDEPATPRPSRADPIDDCSPPGGLVGPGSMPALPPGPPAGDEVPRIAPEGRGDGQWDRVRGIVPEAISDAHVVIVGIGSVGSHLVELLVRSGVGKVTLIDPETVSAANLTRCTFTLHDVGRPKVHVVAERLLAINPALSVNALSEAVDDISGPALGGLIDRCDLVIAATDDPAAQLRLNHHAFAAGVPAVFPGVFARGRGGEVITTLPGVTPCFRCATVARARSGGRSASDYGTGRLVAEPALGADILHVTTVAAKISLALLAGAVRPDHATHVRPPDELDGGGGGEESADEGHLVEFLVDGLVAGSYVMLSTVAGFEFFDEVFAATPAQHAYQTVWMRPTASPACAVCGDARHRVEPTRLDRSAPDLDRLTVAPGPDFGDRSESWQESSGIGCHPNDPTVLSVHDDQHHAQRPTGPVPDDEHPSEPGGGTGAEEERDDEPTEAAGPGTGRGVDLVVHRGDDPTPTPAPGTDP